MFFNTAKANIKGGMKFPKIKGTITNGIKNKLGALLIKKDLKIYQLR